MRPTYTMRWTLLCLCVFAQTYAAPREQQGANSDIFQHQKKKDDVHDFRKRLKGHVCLQEIHEVHDPNLENKNEMLRSDAQETIPDHQRKSEGTKENLSLAQDHRNSVVFYVDNTDFQKSYPGSSHEIVHNNIDHRPNIDALGISKKSPKQNTSLELIFHDPQVTANTVTSKTKIDGERARVRPEHFIPISASFLMIPDQDGNATPDQKSSAYYAGADKRATNDTDSHRDTEGNDLAVSRIEGQDAGMSSGSGDYYTEDTTSKDRGVIVQQHTTNLGREDGRLNSTDTTTVSSGHSESLVNREEGHGNNHHEQVGASTTEATGKQKHRGCHNSAKGMDNRKNTHCNTFVAANKTSICTQFVNSGNTKEIMDLPTACKNMSHNVEASGRARNVDAQTIHYSKGTPILKGHVAHSQTTHEKNNKFRNSRRSRYGKIYQVLGKSSRQMNLPKHVKLSKRKVTNKNRYDDSSSSSGSSSESGQSRSDSGQSK